MNTDDKLLQILENSACLSKGQLTGYLKHTLYPEELRAVEMHLSSCALCNDALEGLETQQDVEKLLASMVPPVLPALAPKEKPKEKKEAPAATRQEKADVAATGAKHTASPKQETAALHDNRTAAFRPRTRWGRPIGVAAALLLGFGALWYFEFNKDTSKKEIAGNMTSIPDSTPALAARQSIADTIKTAVISDSLAKLVAKKHADSVFLVRREEQRLKARKDSLLVLSATTDSDKSVAMQGKSAASSRMADVVSESEQADEPKKVAAAPAAMKAKEKEEAKKEASDFELGMKKYKEKNYASALLYFRSAESDKSDPKHWDAVYYSGLCNRNLSKDRRARKMFERIIDAGAPQKKSAQKQLDDMKKGD